MADRPSSTDANSEAGDDTGGGPNTESAPSTPRWVKVFAIAFIAFVLLFVILHLTGHGLGGHHTVR
jgi:hypothetical protein